MPIDETRPRMLSRQAVMPSVPAPKPSPAPTSPGSASTPAKSGPKNPKSLGDYRHSFKTLSKRFDNLFKQRRPILENYENFANQITGNLINTLTPNAMKAFEQAQQLGDAYTKDFLPASQRYLSDAEGYDTPERRTEERARAMSDVATASDAARKGALERLEAFGVDPSQTRGAALDANIRLQTALAQVAAGTEAERAVEERGINFRRDALGMGSELLAGQNALQQTGAGFLSESAQQANRTSANNQSLYRSGLDVLGMSGDALGRAAGLKVNEEELDAASDDGGGGLAGFGALAGTAAGAFLGSYGGPAGTAAGAQVGAQAGGLAGGAFENRR